MYNRKYYSGDPRKITAKYRSTCPTCKKQIAKGDGVYYWPSARKAYCLECGEEDYRRFLLAASDEAMNESICSGTFY